MSQSYRNARQGFLTDMLVDTTPIGSIVPNLKTTDNSYDHSFVKRGGSYPKLGETTGNAYLTGDDPAYTHEGYLYCDGTIYNIADYPALYAIIGNDYGGRSSSGIDVTNGGSGYTSNPVVTVGAPPSGGAVTYNLNGTEYPIMGSLYVPQGGAGTLNVLVAFHGTLDETGTTTIGDAAYYQRNLWVNTIGVKDMIVFAPAIPQDHIDGDRQYGIDGREAASFLMGDNINYARAAVEWVKNDLISYLATQGVTQTLGDVYVFGHSQGGKLACKINTLTTGIAGVVANAPGPIQFDQTCAADPDNYSCSKVAAIHGASTGDGSSPYNTIGLENYTSTHNAPILFTQALDDTVGGGNQATWLQNYRNAIDAISGNANTTVTTVPTGGHAAYESNAVLQLAIKNFIGAATTYQPPFPPTFLRTLTLTGSSGTGTQATATAQINVQSGEVVAVNIIQAGVGYDWTSPPSVTFSGGGGSGATAVVRIDPNTGGVRGINKANVFEWWGDPNLGTFAVPDTKAKKIVGNSPVFGNNSPNAGNSSLGVGTTGGQWYFAKESQDEFFSLGRIVTSGYDQVVETTGCDIIGSQTVTVSMRETKLSGVFQHSHTVYHSIPGGETWIKESSGDRYLQDFKTGSGRVTRWYPTTGTVYTHKHGLLRQPNDDNTVATYDVFDYLGGAGGNGTIKDPTVSESDQYYLASGAQGAGSYEFQTYIPDPEFLRFQSNSVIGGRNVVTGGTPIYDYSQTWTFGNPGGPYYINLGNVEGSPSVLTYDVIGGGGSGAAGTINGNNGTNSSLKIGDGSAINLVAGGGNKGNGSNGLQGGQGGNGGSTSSTGSEGTGGAGGLDGYDGGNGVSGNGFPEADYPNNPNNGGLQGFLGGSVDGTLYGDGSAGVNVFVGGQSGSIDSTLESNGSFSLAGVTNPTSAAFYVHGGKGGGARGGWSGAQGARVYAEIRSDQLDDFTGNTWSVQIGYAGGDGNSSNSPPSGGSASHSGSGGTGGEGHNDADGGAGGAATLLLRGSQIVIGAGGGGGAGATGYDNGAGTNGCGAPVGLQGTTSALGAGGGGTGGRYGCVGGGGGGGGGGCAVNGLTFGGSGNGGGSSGPGGGPAGDGGHGGGGCGNSGVSSYRTDYFTNGSLSSSGRTNGKVRMVVEYNNDYWTPGGGGGGGGAAWQGNVNWADLNSPSTAEIYVGAGGAGVSASGSSSGSTANGSNGYVKVGLGSIVGYEGGNTTVSIGDIVERGSATADDWDIDIYSSGAGTGTAGNFKLPTTQVPDVLIVGGGGSGATATAVLTSNGTVGAINLTSGGSGYTEQPYVYVVNGAGGETVATATIDAASGTVDGIILANNSSQRYTKYLKLGGLNNQTSKTRFAEIVPVDTSNVNYVSIKACRGNGVNGGDTPEEVVRMYYQLEGSTTWNLLDTIINPNATRTDPLIGDVPAVSQAWDGASGDTKWYTYTVALPSQAKQNNTKIKIEQPRANVSGANDNDLESDHYGIAEIIYWKEKVTELVFVPSAGAISKPAIDSLQYTVQGETGPSITYSSGVGATDARLTLKSTTKVEPVASLDPDFDIPLIHTYRLCKYLIKAF